MIYESVRALGALLTTPPARLTISIHGRFRFVVSAIAERGTLNATRVHAKSSRELREVIRGSSLRRRGKCLQRIWTNMLLEQRSSASRFGVARLCEFLWKSGAGDRT